LGVKIYNYHTPCKIELALTLTVTRVVIQNSRVFCVVDSNQLEVGLELLLSKVESILLTSVIPRSGQHHRRSGTKVRPGLSL